MSGRNSHADSGIHSRVRRQDIGRRRERLSDFAFGKAGHLPPSARTARRLRRGPRGEDGLTHGTVSVGAVRTGFSSGALHVAGIFSAEGDVKPCPRGRGGWREERGLGLPDGDTLTSTPHPPALSRPAGEGRGSGNRPDSREQRELLLPTPKTLTAYVDDARPFSGVGPELAGLEEKADAPTGPVHSSVAARQQACSTDPLHPGAPESNGSRRDHGLFRESEGAGILFRFGAWAWCAPLPLASPAPSKGKKC